MKLTCLLLLAVTACSSDGGGDDDDTCPLSAEARAILTAETTRQALDGAWIVGNSHPMSDRGFARNLMGSTDAHMGSLTPIGPCTGPMEFTPYCDGSRCSELGCVAAGHGTMGVWWDSVPPYTGTWTDVPDAQVAYAGSPSTDHEYIEGTDMLTITWVSSDEVTVTVAGTELDLSSDVDATGYSNDAGPVSMSIQVAYPALAADLLIELGTETPYSGTLEIGGDVVADVAEVTTGEEILPSLTWRTGCDP
jgi:hypothetical protein